MIIFDVFMAMLGFAAYGWARGWKDAGGQLVGLQPWMGLVWGGGFTYLLISEIQRMVA